MEICPICGEELTDEELESPMENFGECDDCADEHATWNDGWSAVHAQAGVEVFEI